MVQTVQKFLENYQWLRLPLRAAIVLLVTSAVVALYRKLSQRVRRDRKLVARRFLQNVITVTLYVIGIYVAFSPYEGFRTFFSTFLKTSSVLTLAISLAAQESLANAINGVFISVFKPFDIGDRVHLINGNITGIIEDITLRHTVIKTYTNSRIIVPNTTMNKDMIENSNFQNNKVSSYVDVMVPYDSNLALAKELMADIVGQHPLFLDNRGPQEQDQPMVPVFVRELTLQGASLRASMWSRNVSENFQACSDAREEIIRQFAEHDIRVSTTIAPAPAPIPVLCQETSEEKEEIDTLKKEEKESSKTNPQK